MLRKSTFLQVVSGGLSDPVMGRLIVMYLKG